MFLTIFCVIIVIVVSSSTVRLLKEDGYLKDILMEVRNFRTVILYHLGLLLKEIVSINCANLYSGLIQKYLFTEFVFTIIIVVNFFPYFYQQVKLLFNSLVDVWKPYGI